MGLRAKLILVVASTVVCLQLVWGWSVVQQKENALQTEVERRGLAVLRAVASTSAVSLANRELEHLDAVLDRYATAKGRELDVLSISIVDMEGYVVGHTDPREYGKRRVDTFVVRAIVHDSPLVEMETADDGPRMRLSMPVVSGMRWGTAVAELSLADVAEQAQKARRQLWLVSVLEGIITAGLLSFLISRLVLRRIERLSTFANRIARGALEARVPYDKVDDEIGLLSRMFNDMADQVEEQTTTLEAKVTARTQELLESNAALEGANNELERAVTRLEELARTDGLTGLVNHRAFHETLDFEIQRTARNPAPLSLLMIDVDHFKRYNDTHGHPSGDTVLRTMANIFQSTLRLTDVVARYGGEEFAVLLIDTDRDHACNVAEKLRQAVWEHNFPGASQSQPKGRVTISVGAAAFPDDGDTAAELIEGADAALYMAKHRGRDQVALAQPGNRSR